MVIRASTRSIVAAVSLQVEVIWHDEKAGFLFQWDDDTYESGKDEMEMDLFTDIEVIGNKTDNPKLLKQCPEKR